MKLFTTTTKAVISKTTTLFTRSIYTSHTFLNTTNTIESLGLRGWQPMVPSVNEARNNKRIANAISHLHLFMETQTGLSNPAVMALTDLITELRNEYNENPLQFVRLSKLMGNWFKINIFQLKRTQGLIPVNMWDSYTNVPRGLVGIFSAFNQLSTDRERIIFIRMVLSILDLYRVVVTPTKPDLGTIVNPGTDIGGIIKDDEIQKSLEMLGIDCDLLTNNFKFANKAVFFHSSSAQGPNGQAVWNSHLDAKALLADKDLFENVQQLALLLERKDLLTVLEEAAKLPDLISTNEEPLKHSKLHIIFENGDKVRPVAIIDYFTQELLSPFHDLVAGILRSIPQDGTFNQNAIASKVKEFTATAGNSLFSFDLTAATDRLPVILQRRIISHIIKIDRFALLWQKVLTFRDFSLGNGHSVRYAVGQPMGAKSSFPMLGLTHHIIVQIAALRVGFSTMFKDYVILGDDIMIANEKVATQYRRIMESLGLAISQHKSIISTNSTTSAQIAEICRRVFVRGIEITPLPMKLIANVFENGSMFLQLQEKLTERGLVFAPENFELLVAGFKLSLQDFNQVVLQNSLPQWLTKLTETFSFEDSDEWNFKTWTDVGIDEQMLLEFWKYTVISEQFKRISTLIQAATNGFKAISKAISLGDILFAQDPQTGDRIPAKMFTLETLQQWNILKVAHPARFVMLKEVERISGIMRRVASARGAELFVSLMDSIVDQLKYSILEVIKDKDLKASQMTRSMIDKTLANMRAANLAENKQLSFTVKLESLSIVWVLKVSLNGSCTLSESTMNVPTTTRDAKAQLLKYRSQNQSFKSSFGSSKST
uniref:Putative RNA-dependent RNA polymerase n=1 Tax=Rhizoctonia solani mitovirus 1 TaxID=1708330 RepID=A0A8K1M973_9VIRU|nr:putative RNA-dependent RNA polymerase [Rhizoctonia solani mitovirus 1]